MGCCKKTDLWVTTKNEMGALAKLTATLKNNNVNVENFVAWEEGSDANFRFVTSDNTKAKETWANAGYTVQETPVVLWNTTNTPGALNTAMTALAEANVNTICTYATTTGTDTTTVVFYTDNPDRANEVLNKVGTSCCCS